ncbi:LacI family DNA-binding transcriptional regulator [Curtobacterium ammoniigenes]|uniref:LacI family DNA-binding transcriptional regulator n=1 Tax=Curtobacterium ammoniigenes TaxID=395387 RepID=UPI0009F8414F|nr:LacI family DNA-binding transcriptional regulator [Curtobacterium ammoniigenes]
MTIQTSASERTTLALVASEAQVSLSTVSKVLNGRTGVSAPTRARIETLLHEHGYNRRGSTRSSSLVEVVFAELGTSDDVELNSQWSTEIIRGVERVAREAGLSVVVTESGDRRSPVSGWLDRVLEHDPVGVIFVVRSPSAELRKRLRIRKVPFVVIDPAGEPDPEVPSIGAANWAGGVQAARHLLDLGHRRVGVITGPQDMIMSRARLSGFRSAIDNSGIGLPPNYIRYGSFDVASGIAQGLDLLNMPEPPTAIFAESDLQALGVYEAARTLGLRIPADLSVVGFDGLPLGRWVAPPLTTIRQPIVDMAAQAARLVIALRESPDQDHMRVDLETRLVVRGSTMPLHRTDAAPRTDTALPLSTSV